MKVYLLFLLSVFLVSPRAFAQLGLHVFTGYTFKEQFPVTPALVKISDGIVYGAGIDIGLLDLFGFELSYQGQQVELNVSDDNGINETDKGAVQYVQLAGIRLYPITDFTSIYGGLHCGSVMLTNYEKSTTTYRFGWGGKAGVRHRLSDLLALKGQFQLLAVTHAAEAAAWPGTTGTNNYTGYAYALQFGITTGVIVTPFIKLR